MLLAFRKEIITSYMYLVKCMIIIACMFFHLSKQTGVLINMLSLIIVPIVRPLLLLDGWNLALGKDHVFSLGWSSFKANGFLMLSLNNWISNLYPLK